MTYIKKEFQQKALRAVTQAKEFVLSNAHITDEFLQGNEEDAVLYRYLLIKIAGYFYQLITDNPIAHLSRKMVVQGTGFLPINISFAYGQHRVYLRNEKYASLWQKVRGIPTTEIINELLPQVVIVEASTSPDSTVVQEKSNLTLPEISESELKEKEGTTEIVRLLLFDTKVYSRVFHRVVSLVYDVLSKNSTKKISEKELLKRPDILALIFTITSEAYFKNEGKTPSRRLVLSTVASEHLDPDLVLGALSMGGQLSEALLTVSVEVTSLLFPAPKLM